MKVHFLGIGGSGASGAAAIAENQGYEITGCDLEPINEFTTVFKPDQLFKGHSVFHLTGGNVDILAVTPAIYSLDPKNPELLQAKKLGIPIMTWQEFLGKYLAKDRRGLFSRRLKNKFIIAVAGTHGKTTTTAMIAKILEDANLDPTVLLGAIVPWWGTNFRVSTHRHPESDGKSDEGSQDYFVIEADEYNDNFLNFKPDIAVVTNIEMDHPEYFKDLEAVKKSFDKFKAQSKKVFERSDPKLIDFPLQVPGDFNILNALLALQVGAELGIKKDIIKKSLQNYTGIGRRFEYLGDYRGAKIYSDFGHHPTEIKVTMEAARQKFPQQYIWLIFQPHMFTRTYKLFAEFVKVFQNLPVDKIIITDIYQSREVDSGLVNSKQLADAINKKNVSYVSKKELLKKLKNELRENHVIFFMGAGDIDKFATHFLN